jgi:hypothetical protein
MIDFGLGAYGHDTCLHSLLIRPIDEPPSEHAMLCKCTAPDCSKNVFLKIIDYVQMQHDDAHSALPQHVAETEEASRTTSQSGGCGGVLGSCSEDEPELDDDVLAGFGFLSAVNAFVSLGFLSVFNAFVPMPEEAAGADDSSASSATMSHFLACCTKEFPKPPISIISLRAAIAAARRASGLMLGGSGSVCVDCVFVRAFLAGCSVDCFLAGCVFARASILAGCNGSDDR